MSRADAIARLTDRLAALDVHDGRAEQIRSRAEIDKLEAAEKKARQRIDAIHARMAEIRKRGEDPAAAADAYLGKGRATVHDELEKLDAERQELQLVIRGLTVRINDAHRAGRYPGGPLRRSLGLVGNMFGCDMEPEIARICGELAELYAILSISGRAFEYGPLQNQAIAIGEALSHLANIKLVDRTIDAPSDFLDALSKGREAFDICKLWPPESYQVPGV